MRSKSTRVVCDSHLPDETRPALCLTDFGLMEIDSDDAPVLTLTPAALTELEEDHRTAVAADLMGALNEFEFRPIALAEAYQMASKAHAAFQAAPDLAELEIAARDMSAACENLYFCLKAMTGNYIRDKR